MATVLVSDSEFQKPYRHADPRKKFELETKIGDFAPSQHLLQSASPSNMARELLNDSASSSDSEDSDHRQAALTVNRDFAERFEHNKRREELQKLEEKHGGNSRKRKRDNDDQSDSASTELSSSESEDEDDAGELATTTLDTEILATLNAIKSKDPRVYDGETTFYTAAVEPTQPKKDSTEKPIYLRDYHRETLLSGDFPEAEDPILTYDQEQESLKQSIVKEMHAVAQDSDEEDDMLVAKKKHRPIENHIDLDIENADRDPETFLSNFMAARAWVPTDKSAWQPLESDDEEDERKAEAFEAAYNMRFEDPNKSNEVLRTHARDMATKYSVRRDDNNLRKKKRDAEKDRKVLEKQQRREEKARLRKLRIEEVEEKVRKIKHAAGINTNDLRPEDWSRFVDEDWDDARWDDEMLKHFGDDYYAENEAMSGEDGETTVRRKPKKPKFDNDIDINDIVPEFDQDQEAEFSLTEDESNMRKDHKKIKEQQKKDSRKERRIIEQLVDDQLQFELQDTKSNKGNAFRYRETSPQSFGLSSRDILLADDSQLNQFAGLKKLAAFRDADKKRKDKKNLGKKARLRQWRKETFGDEDGLQEIVLEPSQSSAAIDEDNWGQEANAKTTGKKRRRRAKKAKP